MKIKWDDILEGLCELYGMFMVLVVTVIVCWLVVAFTIGSAVNKRLDAIESKVGIERQKGHP